MSTGKDSSNSQHDQLRKRLEQELSILKSSTDNTDFDWFLNSNTGLKNDAINIETNQNKANTTCEPAQGIPISPLKSPSLARSPNTKAKPSISMTDRDEDLMVGLSRSRTADAKMMSSSTSRKVDNGLRRTATNTDTADFSGAKPRYHEPIITNKPPILPPKKKGFFKKLFGSKNSDDKSSSSKSRRILSPSSSKSPSPSRSPSLSSPSPSPASPSPPSPSSLKPQTSKYASSKQQLASPNDSITRVTSVSPVSSVPGSVTSSIFKSESHQSQNSVPLTISERYQDVDPELSSYLLEMEKNSMSNKGMDLIDYNNNFIYSPSGLQSVKYKEDEIPEHPDKPKRPSAFSSKQAHCESLEKELFLKHKREREEKESSMFGSLLHRARTNTNELSRISSCLEEGEDTPPLTFQPIEYVHPPPKFNPRPPLSTFDEIKPMKKVAFAATTFVIDPPQQIPSRNPRKGNVEICPNGELIIHKIDPQEKLNAATGIVVGGSGHLKLINHEDEENGNKDEDTDGANKKDLGVDVPQAATMRKASSTASVNSQISNHTIKKEERALAAEKARQHHDYDDIDVQKEHLTIDKPMVRRRKQMETPVVTLKMDELYTRCCHLREILPIPATLKQIPKGTTDPIPYLHLRNPRPSMIEILSFTDFIRIAPVICVSLDGVSLTHEMFRIVLSSLMYKRYLEKLSLRNTKIDEKGWKMLCLFLSMNKALKKLDLTQCPFIDVNTQRIKKKPKDAPETRMTCNINDRSDRNWALFTAALIFRGGIDDVILTGCKVPDLKLFANLLTLGLSKSEKVGLAYNSLELQHCKIIARWLQINKVLLGIDLAYNDLSSCLKPFIDFAEDDNISKDNILMFSLNSCNLIDCDETNEFLNSLSNLPNLKYLDLSSNSKFMKSALDKLLVLLPLLHQLVRLNVDNNQLSTESMVKLIECVSLMPNLSYLSIMGNEMNEIVAAALCRALKHSKTLYSIIFDKSPIPNKLQEKIGLLTIKNVESQLYHKQNVDTKTFADIISASDKKEIRDKLGLTEGMSFSESLYKIMNTKNIDQDALNKFIDLMIEIRTHIMHVIQDLIHLNSKNQLTMQGKELLIRLYTMNASVNKAMELIDQHRYAELKEKSQKKIDMTSYDTLMNSQFIKLPELQSDCTAKEDDEVIEATPMHHSNSLKDTMLSTNDPYDLISMLRRCRMNDISLKDLFTKSSSSAKAESETPAIDEGRDTTIKNYSDDMNLESTSLDDIQTKNEEEAQMTPVYDKILHELLKNDI